MKLTPIIAFKAEKSISYNATITIGSPWGFVMPIFWHESAKLNQFLKENMYLRSICAI